MRQLGYGSRTREHSLSGRRARESPSQRARCRRSNACTGKRERHVLRQSSRYECQSGRDYTFRSRKSSGTQDAGKRHNGLVGRRWPFCLLQQPDRAAVLVPGRVHGRPDTNRESLSEGYAPRQYGHRLRWRRRYPGIWPRLGLGYLKSGVADMGIPGIPPAFEPPHSCRTARSGSISAESTRLVDNLALAHLETSRRRSGHAELA